MMWKMIFSMLSARKTRYGWLTAELAVVAMAVWALLDPIIVQQSIEWQDKGFEEQHLYRIELNQYPQDSPRFVHRNQEEWNDDRWRLLRMVSDYKGVSSATFQGQTAPFSQSSSTTLITHDTLSATVFNMEFVPRSNFFTTFRFSGNGQLDCAVIDRMAFGDGGSVVSEGTFPDRTSMGLVDTLSMVKVVATTGMVRMRHGMPAVPVRMVPQPNMQAQAIVCRINSRMDGDSFRTAFTAWTKKHLKAGNYYAGEVQTYREYIRSGNNEVASFMQTRTVLGAFFLFCLFLGVSGTFWMQTDSRREEIGIMKSFGATSAHIIRILITEGIILATAAVMAGCFIYLQYALKEGLYTPIRTFGNNLYGLLSGRYWFEDFATHFAIVSFITWAIVVIVVCIGIYIPASRISRITPTDALRDE